MVRRFGLKFSINPGPSQALAFTEKLRASPLCRTVSPRPGHWDLFTGLCREIGAGPNDVPDAYLAALAIESGCEWISTDRGFAPFKRVNRRPPF